MDRALATSAALETYFPFGCTELAGLIRRFDWSITELGPISEWPDYLRTTVDMVVQSPTPMVLLWGRRGVMIYNDGYAKLAGPRHPQILGKTAVEGWPEVADFNRNVLRCVLQGESLTYRDQALTLLRSGKPEETFFTIFYSPVVGPSGIPEAVLAIVNETTCRVRAEQQRGDAEEMLRSSNLALKRANADLEQFAFSASHDLQEPLRMVSLYSQLLKRKLAGTLDAESAVLLNHCTDGASRLDSLIKGLLEYVRASSEADVDAGMTTTPLDEILKCALANLETAIEESGAQITFDSLPALHVHPVHIQQVLQNLIGNAIKYRSARPAEIHIGAHFGTSHWTFSVEDNGIGVGAAYRDQIFGLFKRLHGSGEYAGTGLGLAICRRLVERYDGRIWMDSVLGEGSTFYFTLPRAE